MKKKISLFKKYGINPTYVLILVGAVLVSAFVIIFADRRSRIIETPTALEVMNISNNSVDIYWKSEDSNTQTVVYKEKGYSGTYNHSIDVKPELYDNNTNKYIYTATINGLDDNTEYSYRILSTNNTYGDFTFKTHKVDEKIALPTIYDGTIEKNRLIMVEVGDDKYMIDTEDHGTYAFNTNGNKPTLVEYANYSSTSTVLAAKSSTEKITNLSMAMFSDQFQDTQQIYDYLAKIYGNSNSKGTMYTAKDIANAIQQAKGISQNEASMLAAYVAANFAISQGWGNWVNENGKLLLDITGTTQENIQTYYTIMNKMSQLLLLEAQLNGCSVNDTKCLEGAGEDFGEVLTKVQKILQATTVSYLDVFGENASFVGGENANKAPNGEQYVRTCYQMDHCETAHCNEKGGCILDIIKPGSGVFIEQIANPTSSAENEAYVDPTCISEKCLDYVPPCCSGRKQSDGCNNKGTDTQSVLVLFPVAGEYSCPQDFQEGTEHLLANGDTGYVKGTNYCYGKKVASQDMVQRGTPAVKFTGPDSIDIEIDSNPDNNITFTEGMNCVYESLTDYEQLFAFSDEFLAGDALKGLGSGFADNKKYGPGEIASGIGTYTDSEGKECPCKQGDVIPDTAQSPYYSGITNPSTPEITPEEPETPEEPIEEGGGGDINEDYYCNPNEIEVTVTDQAMRCSAEEGCACLYPDVKDYSECFDCQADADVFYVCAVEGDSCNPDGSLTTWKYCYDNEEVIDLEDEDVKCTSSNGCACITLSGKQQCAKKGEVCKADSGLGFGTPKDPTIEVGGEISDKDIKCKEKEGCTCKYTLPGESETIVEIAYGEICSYPDGKKTELSITKTSPSLDCIDQDGCTCTITEANNNRTIIDVESGYTCTLDGKSEKTNNICCYYDGTLGMMSSTFCHSQASKDSKVTALDDIEEDSCSLVKVGMSFEKGNNFFEQFNVLESDESTAKTAKELINNTHHKITTVATITSGKWSDIVKYDEENCSKDADYICGEDFELVPGSVYYVKVRTPFKYAAKSLSTPIDVEEKYNSLTKNVSGWNLLPTDIFLKDGRSSIDIIDNSVNSVDQVAVWNNNLASFEYTLKDQQGEVYGSDLDIGKQIGVFVKMNKK